MDWAELENAQPALADLGRRRLLQPGVVLVATIRSDGTPRISPVEPLLLDGRLWLSMMWDSRKAADLIRDLRLLVHSVITSRYDDASGDQHVATWPPPREFLRRGTTATSLGPPEAVSEILIGGLPGGQAGDGSGPATTVNGC